MVIAELTSIEIIAFALAVLILLKVLLILARPKFLANVSGKITGNTALFTLLGLILVALTGYHVLANVNIVTIGAVVAFTGSLMALAWAPYSKLMTEMRDKMTVNSVRKSWLSIVLWTILAVWILYALIV